MSATIDPLAQAVMVAYCGWDPTAAVEDASAVLDGNGTTLLQLPSLWVRDVAAVTVTGRFGDTYQPTIGPAGDVNWSDNGCLDWNGPGVWPEGRRNVAVTYSGGYTEPPADLIAALNSIGKRTSTPMGIASRRMGSAAIAYAQKIADGGLLTVEQMVLDRYRIPRAA